MFIMHGPHVMSAHLYLCEPTELQKDNSIPRENGFDNKRVVIVGGSSGIGLGPTSSSFPATQNEFRELFKSIGAKAQGQTVDVSDEKAVESFFANLGAFDHLVFTAGDSLPLNEVAITDLKQARRAFELRYWTALAGAKYGSPHLRKGGSVVLRTGVDGHKTDGQLPQGSVAPSKL